SRVIRGGRFGLALLPRTGPVRSTWPGVLIIIPRDCFAAIARHQVGEDADVDVLIDEVHRAVREQRINAARVEAVDLAGSIHAEIGMWVLAENVLTVRA